MKTKSYTTGFPVFALSSAGKNNEFLVGGGGGGAKAGIKNAVVLYKVDPLSLEVAQVADYVFGKDDDGCMSLAAHPSKSAFVAGVNSSENEIRMGENRNCRFFYIHNKSAENSVQTSKSTDPTQYQRVCKFSKDGKTLVSGCSDGHLSFWSWPGMRAALPAHDFEGSEILDLHIDHSNGNLAVATSSKLRILDLSKGKIRHVRENLNYGSVSCQLRSIRFGCYISDGILFAVLNSSNKKQSYIQLMTTTTWKVMKTMQICNKPTTAFSIRYINDDSSERGGLLAFGSSDMSVSVWDAKKLTKLVKVPDVHSFPVTAIDFNLDGTLVVSGSADGTIVAVAIPDEKEPKSVCEVLIIIFILIILALLMILPGDMPDL